MSSASFVAGRLGFATNLEHEYMNPITQIHRRPSSPISYGLLSLVALFLASAGFAAEPATKNPSEAGGWKELFAPDLSNAIVATNSWIMENGVLVAKDHETIWTKETYGNFILDLDFKVAPDANSGVFLRSGNIKNVLGALEIQVHASTDGSKYGMVGALYDAKPPSKNAAKPVGEWNHYTITCRDSHLSLVFNGEPVLDVNLDDWTEVKKNPDGTPNKFSRALKDFSRKGSIGLQGLHGKAAAPVWYRNLKIKNLD